MRMYSSNSSFLFVLITAFLSLQWSATHIHLADEHEHDGGQHQHAVTAHQHQLVSHHADAIDVSDEILPHTDGSKVVELKKVCTQHKGKLGDQFEVLFSVLWDKLEVQTASSGILLSFQQGVYQSYQQYAYIRPRAPPIT